MAEEKREFVAIPPLLIVAQERDTGHLQVVGEEIDNPRAERAADRAVADERFLDAWVVQTTYKGRRE